MRGQHSLIKRYKFLDGIRGLTALYVVVYHAFAEIASNSLFPLPQRLSSFFKPFMYGNLAVDIFIVLSGFCLMLPILSAIENNKPYNWRTYFIRRSRRILPPYYAVWLLTMLLIVIVPGVTATPGTDWSGDLKPFSPAVVVTHALLLHNFHPIWQLNINYPLWSVATEWQIYFLLPLALLPIFRRWGLGGLFVLSTLAGVGLAGIDMIVGGRPWFIALFAYGMIAASLSNKSIKHPRGLAAVSALCWTLAWILHWIYAAPSLFQIILEDCLIGISTAAALALFAGSDEETSNRFSLVRFLNVQPLQRLGYFSYSIYLCHAPILALVHMVTWRMHMHPTSELIAQAFAAVPLSVFAAYLFHLAFERPFLRTRPLPAPEPNVEQSPLTEEPIQSPAPAPP